MQSKQKREACSPSACQPDSLKWAKDKFAPNGDFLHRTRETESVHLVPVSLSLLDAHQCITSGHVWEMCLRWKEHWTSLRGPWVQLHPGSARLPGPSSFI